MNEYVKCCGLMKGILKCKRHHLKLKNYADKEKNRSRPVFVCSKTMRRYIPNKDGQMTSKMNKDKKSNEMIDNRMTMVITKITIKTNKLKKKKK